MLPAGKSYEAYPRLIIFVTERPLAAGKIRRKALRTWELEQDHG
jgi:hypothetical protein